jgi:hypothetical protein
MQGRLTPTARAKRQHQCDKQGQRYVVTDFPHSVMKTNVGINIENSPIIVHFYEWSNNDEAIKSESEN